MNTRSRESIGTWRASREFREFLFREVIPVIERNNGTSLALALKAASSTTITEGYGRYDYELHEKSCQQTKLSLLECVKHLAQAHVEKVLPDHLYTESLSAANEALTLLDGYATHLSRSKSSLFTSIA